MISCRQIMESVNLILILFPRVSLLVLLKGKKERERLGNYERKFGDVILPVRLLKATAKHSCKISLVFVFIHFLNYKISVFLF